ncbi:MAG: helix-turn-helix domain-containing protein [Candidatus Omnitrophica bacterium]|nr:helix-turn-helix domain-containing protein [Candidatus Omnitrophota bacterium]
MKRFGEGGRAAEIIAPLLTVQQVCRRLKKSRRQIYRYLQAGRLTACARILGQWLFDPSAVEGLERAPLPRSFRRFFWDTPLSGLSADTHRDFILGRLLERGDWQAAQWVFRTYPRASVREFLKGRGRDVLSERGWRFWALVLGLKSGRRPQTRWRRAGRRWGGIG